MSKRKAKNPIPIFSRLKNNRTSFNYLDNYQIFVARWDNSPHHSDVETFLNYLHAKNEIRNSRIKSILDASDELEFPRGPYFTSKSYYRKIN